MAPKRHGAPWWGKLLMLLLTIGIASGVGLGVRLVTSVSKALSATSADTNASFFEQLQQLILPSERSLRGESEDRINVLLLGMGGEGHEGAYLTDTIIVASFRPSTDRVTLLSIPRDLVVEIPGSGFRKINNANALGEFAGPPGKGAELAVAAVEGVIGQSIHYYVRVDFSGFAQVIDDVGGITVNVERSFIDYNYPTEDFGAQTVSFEAGEHEFDGATALKYVRSRHGNNGEGSDFARSRRQQLVLVALKKKLLSLGTLFNPNAIAAAVTTLGGHVRTNLEPWEMAKFARLARTIDVNTITTHVLDNSADGLLIADTGLDGAYILLPRTGDFDEIHRFVGRILEVEPAVVETAVVELQNGTTIPGLAARVADELEDVGLTVDRIGNAIRRGEQTTTIVDLTNGTKAASLATLKQQLHAEVIAVLPALVPGNPGVNISDLGGSLVNADLLEDVRERSTGVDFVVILGTDQLDRLQSRQSLPAS